MTPDLSTTNLFLGVLAAASLLQMIAAVALCAGILILCRRVIALLAVVEKEQLAPAAARVHAILDDVKTVTSTARAQAGHFDAAARWALNLISRFGRGASAREHP